MHDSCGNGGSLIGSAEIYSASPHDQRLFHAVCRGEKVEQDYRIHAASSDFVHRHCAGHTAESIPFCTWCSGPSPILPGDGQTIDESNPSFDVSRGENRVVGGVVHTCLPILFVRTPQSLDTHRSRLNLLCWRSLHLLASNKQVELHFLH
jgi:hypothetical protein